MVTGVQTCALPISLKLAALPLVTVRLAGWVAIVGGSSGSELKPVHIAALRTTDPSLFEIDTVTTPALLPNTPVKTRVSEFAFVSTTPL